MAKKQLQVTLPTWDVNKKENGEDITLTTEEIEYIKPFDHVTFNGPRRAIARWCTVTVKDKRRFFIRGMKADEVHTMIKDAGGRLRAEDKEETEEAKD